MILSNNIISTINKKTTRLIYRGTILLYGASILCIYDNRFNAATYIIASLIYIIIELIKYKKYPIIRTVGDYFIICTVLAFKDINNAFLFTYFLLPIINSVNYTGKRNRVYILILLYSISYLTLTYFSGTISWADISRQLPVILSIWLLMYSSKILWERNKINRDLLDILLTHQASTAKPHEIYGKIIDRLNDRKTIKSITCFATDNFNRFQLVNSSNYIFQYELSYKNKKRDCGRLKRGDIVTNASFTIDRTAQNTNLILPVLGRELGFDDRHYVFIFVSDTEYRYKDIFTIISLEPFFINLAKYIYTLHSIEEAKQFSREQIIGHYKFVQSAINTMHFIRNRLTPYQTLLDLYDDANANNFPTEITNLLTNTAVRARIELSELLKRSEYLLEKGNDPYNHQELSNISIKKLHGCIRDIWNFYFIDDIKTDSKSKPLSSDNLYVLSNINALNILLTDIIGNINKYYRDEAKCTVSINDTDLCIIFENNFTNHVSA